MEPDKRHTEPYFAYISEEADLLLELLFEHPDGLTDKALAQTLGLLSCEFLIEELHLAGIDVRREVRDGEVVYLAPLKE